MQLNTRYRHSLLASLGALALTLTLMLGIALPFADLRLESKPTPVREVEVAKMQPPPPPQSVRTPEDAEVILDVQGSGAPVLATETQSMQVAEFELPPPDTSYFQAPDVQVPDIEWAVFSLSELDGVPRLLTQPDINAPAELRRRLSGTHVVRLDVRIDERGQVTLLNIVESPHPDLAQALERMVQRARFTPPQRAGETVAARFIWPLEIEI